MGMGGSLRLVSECGSTQFDANGCCVELLPCTDPAPDETRLRLQREAIVHIIDITKRDCLALFERMLKEVVNDLARRAFRKRTCRLLLRSRSAALLVTTPDGSGLVTYLEM